MSKVKTKLTTHMSQREQVLHRPGMYIGSIDNIMQERWVIIKDQDPDHNNKLISVKREVKYNAGLEQCILELLTNAIDHTERTKNDKNPVKKIEIQLTKEYFEIINDGAGIPLDYNEECKAYNPEVTFGFLNSSTNYDDDEKRLVGGMNGIGAKAANIFSKRFVIELVTNGQKYCQEFMNNMSDKTKPKITKVKSKDYVKIVFYPDFDKFKVSSFKDDDNILVISKRIYDTSAVTNKSVSVIYNDEKINIKDFSDYVSLYIYDQKKVIYRSDDGRWEIIISLNPYSDSTVISFVNGLCVDNGGTHVNHVYTPLITKLNKYIKELKKVKKDNLKIESKYIKDSLIVFIKCLIENPTFNSQMKTELILKQEKFGSKCELSEKFVSDVMKLNFIDKIIEETNKMIIKKNNAELKNKGSRILDIDKLIDANFAGTKRSLECTLIITEGDSAKAMVQNGISAKNIGSDKYGIFPLKGKPINIREATQNQLLNNEEINNLCKILGLEKHNKDTSNMRYGKLMILTDQDTDGLHIKGLIINFINYWWPNLLKNDFLVSMLTPIVKVFIPTKKSPKKILNFYDLNDFHKFVKGNTNNNKFDIKYYKGLGTSNKDEAVEIFSNMSNNIINFKYSLKEDEESLSLAFDKKRANDRKDWITKNIINPPVIDYKQNNVNVNSFINNQFVQFSIADCERSLPSIIDGLKVSQRKVLYGSLKENINKNKEIKVAQLGAIIAKETEYHHGENSLFQTIIGMAQDFVGSNNIPLLYPEGTFGSRHGGGKDASQPRYIYTYIQDWTYLIFNKLDEPLLTYNYEDNKQIEPKQYIPIIPMILVNGALGIATGFSCNLPSYNPKDIINNIRRLMKNEEIEDMIPWFHNFTGKIFKHMKKDTKVKGTEEDDSMEDDDTKNWSWKSRGCFKLESYKNKYKLIITELPIGLWSSVLEDKYLKKYRKDGIIKDFGYHPNNPNSNKKTGVYYEIIMEDHHSDEYIIDLFKLETTIKEHIVGFSSDLKIKKYSGPNEILKEFYTFRIQKYQERKDYIINDITNKLKFLSEKSRFIQYVINDKIIIYKRNLIDIENDLKTNDFKQIDNSYNYLLRLNISHFTKDEITKLQNEIENLNLTLNNLITKTPIDLWNDDLKELENLLNKEYY